MFAILGVSIVSLYLLFYSSQKKHIEIWVEAVSVWCVLLFAKTEIMSLFSGITPVSCFSFWLIITIMAFVWITYRRKWNGILEDLGIVVKKHLDFGFLLLGGGIVCLALLTVPYNWDSMTYHLPRVVYWAQNGSVAHYATNSIRQVASPPFHEFICLDLYILSGKRDFLFNMVQCGAFLTNAWLVYEIARKLGVQRKFSKIGALLFFSMPIAFGEALTTQNDNLACMFLLIFVYFLLDFLNIGRRIEFNKTICGRVLSMSVCIGLGYLTKPTVSIGMAVLAVILLIFCMIRRDSLTSLIKLLLISAVSIGLILFPEIARNVQTFGAVFPSITGPRQLVGTLNPRYLFINMLKNVSFNLPTNYINHSDDILVWLINQLASLIRVNINDLSIAEDGRLFSLSVANMGHDTAVNAAVMYTFLFALAWCFYRRKKSEKGKRLYTYVVTLLYVIICMFIRWEPFVSRYMLPYLALLCPVVSVWVEDMYCHAGNTLLKYSCAPIVCWVGITGILLLFSYHSDIILKQKMLRPDGYFYNRSEILEEYTHVCDVVQNEGAERIGLDVGGDSYEYPIHYMLKHSAKQIENIMIDNETRKYEDGSYIPDCIISIKDMGEETEFHGNVYVRCVEGGLSVYMRQ